MKTFISDLSKKEFSNNEKVSARTLRKSVMECIQAEHPDFNYDCNLSIGELNHYRGKYISDSLVKEIGELNVLEKTVLTSLEEGTSITNKLSDDDDEPTTTGQHIADKVASFGGSWKFIISFGVFLLLWIAFNTIMLANQIFDPYPYILLNLILSCLAAMQAPVIMMSQNRQEEKDRQRAKKDFMINLKSELEIRLLHEKIDHLIMHQQQDLLEIQKVQIEMMNDILSRMGPVKQVVLGKKP